MTVQVTLSLPENLVEQVQRYGRATRQDVETVLVEALETVWPHSSPSEEFYTPVVKLSDEEIITLADSKMDAAQHKRLLALQGKGKKSGLTLDERYELTALLKIYQLGQLRKSEALAETVRRGLRKPLAE